MTAGTTVAVAAAASTGGRTTFSPVHLARVPSRFADSGLQARVDSGRFGSVEADLRRRLSTHRRPLVCEVTDQATTSVGTARVPGRPG